MAVPDAGKSSLLKGSKWHDADTMKNESVVDTIVVGRGLGHYWFRAEGRCTKHDGRHFWKRGKWERPECGRCAGDGEGEMVAKLMALIELHQQSDNHGKADGKKIGAIRQDSQGNGKKN